MHRAPTFLCTPINTEAMGEGETKDASWSKCQSPLIGSPSSGVEGSPGRGRRSWSLMGVHGDVRCGTEAL